MGVLVWGLGLLVLLTAGIRAWLLRQPQLTIRHRRGRRLGALAEARAAFGTEGYQFGSVKLPHRFASSHIAIVGATGSGKTMLQRLLMQSALPRIGSGTRALIYDAKQDIMPLLAGMKVRTPIHLMNPLDARSVAWDMATDVTSPVSALQVATLLIPKATSDANPFFSNAARHLLYGVLLSMILNHPGRWTLRQVVLVLRNEARLRKVLGAHESTRFLLQYCEHAATFQNILSTLLTRLAPYEIIAAAWDRLPSALSLRQWLQSESILVLGNDEANRAAIDTMNQLIFKRLSELILAQPETHASNPSQTWLFLDEVRQAGKLEGLSSLMTKGRSKGAAVVLGFQDINGLREVYGREGADELIGQCNSKAILRLNSPETARWASQVVGSSEYIETQKSRSRTRRNTGIHESSGVSFSDGIRKRELILDSEFLSLPETTPETGLTAVMINPVSGVYRDFIPGDWLSNHLLPPSIDVLGFVPCDESSQLLRPWSQSDALLFESVCRAADHD